jgi:predicted enzyme related to lactoylglutathione lyase
VPRIVHFNLPVDDPERATAFYSKVFGWTFEKVEALTTFWFVKTGPDEEPGINGTLYARVNGQPEGLCNVVDVTSVDEAVASIESAGGTVKLAKLTLPGIGWLAVVTDPEANVFTLLQPDRSAA